MVFDYRYIFYVIFGILPSLVWLFYYLSKDLHPEPKRMILKIFLWGTLVTVPVFFVQVGLKILLENADFNPLMTSIIYWFLIIALSEEIFKYLVVRTKVLNNSCMDEPMDIMIYMVVAALGFAALENILYLFAPVDQLTLNDLLGRTMLLSFTRFIGATFLHTLCSAVIGYSVAISCKDQKNKYLEVMFGIITAVGLHGLYNFSIMMLEGDLQYALPVVTLIILAIFAFWGFERLKKEKSVTILNEN